MKKTLITLFTSVLTLTLQAQTFPYGINYQAVARDANGNAKTNQSVNIRFSINMTTAGGPLIWQETNSVITNSMGQFNAVIGSGTTTGGGSAASFSVIDWGADVHWLTVAIFNGTSYINIASQQFQSVPYALSTPGILYGVFEEKYAYSAGGPSTYGLGGQNSIPINSWTGTSGQTYIPLTVKNASNTPAISYSSGLITLAPGTYLIRAFTNNQVDLSANASLTLKSRIIDAGSTVLADGSVDYWYYGPSAAGDAGRNLISVIDQVVTISNSTAIKFQRYVARGGSGSYLSEGIDHFISNEDVVLSNLYIQKIK